EYFAKNTQKRQLLDILEQARKYLLAYVQPRLVWECTLLALHRAVSP
ncbi:MAG: DNA polymerase III subunit delta', partial [Microcystaceae cyanobacterium]